MAETTDISDSGQYESKKEDIKSKEDFVARWVAEVDLRLKTEDKWIKDADEARDAFRSEGKSDKQRFNIQYSNIQTEVPALFNSTPTPDVRTRYQDEDEKSRLAGQAIERVLSFSVDQYGFDETIKMAVQDRQLAGRGQVRVRYKPYEYQGKVYQEVECEHVPWKHYGFGPCTEPAARPWEYFEHFLTRGQLQQLNPEIGGGINLDFSLGTGRKGERNADAPANVFKRARVYEIWDKETRKVIWIAPSYKLGPVRVDDDPLGLIGFYSTPCPMYAIRTSDSTVPKCPYSIIKPLADELEEVTQRIQALIKVCRWRGIRHPAIPSFERMEEAEDGELVAAVDGSEIMQLIQGAGLDKFVWLMPVEQVILVLKQLYEQREHVKQTIFEVSGLSDILRGQTDPNETLGAQEIKSNFGTLRLQDGQKEVARFCRDLFRIKAEIACNHFDSQNLLMMTGMTQPSREEVMQAQMQIQRQEAMAAQQAAMPPQMGDNGGPPMEGQPPPQGPPPVDPELQKLAEAISWEDILEILKSGMLRMYRIDIETDSTVRGDVRQAQQNAGLFLEGTAKFMQAFGPIIQAGAMPKDVAIDIYAGAVRSFKLGKQSEDAIARWSADAQKAAKNPEPQPPSPEEMKMQAEAEKMKMQMGAMEQKHGLEMQKLQAGIQADQQKNAMAAGAKQAELEQKQREADMQMENDIRKAHLDFELQARQAEFDMQSAERQDEIDQRTQLRKEHFDSHAMQRKAVFDERKAAIGERQAEEKHKRMMSQPAKGRA